MARSIQEHRAALIRALADTVPAQGATQHLPLGQAAGRILREPVTAPVDLPPFTNSQMDGFAVDTAALRELVRAGDREVRLPVSGIQPAGAAPVRLVPGTACAVMTGAVLPTGADAVIPVEHVDPPDFSASHVRVPVQRLSALEPGTFVRPVGSDVVRGAVALPAGTLLGPAALGACAGLGLTAETSVTVARGPDVLAISGGDEVVAPGQPLPPGGLYDANLTLLNAWLREAGARSVREVRVADDPQAFRDRLDAALAAHRPELIVTSGGISAGAFEVVRTALERHGQMWFGHVAMQPGGPQGCGTYRGVPVVSLPGNPVSTWVSCELLVRAALAATWGCTPALRWASAALGETVARLPGRTQYRRASLTADGAGAPTVRMLGSASSHLLTRAAHADVLAEIPAGTGEVPAGTRVRVAAVHGGVNPVAEGDA